MALSTFLTPGVIGAAAVVFPVVGFILVVMRTRIRLRKSESLGIEDWLVFVACQRGTLVAHGPHTLSHGPPRFPMGHRSLR